ncbi:hypothetical protein QOT17_004266 [Balamuthia mandrillaris]
MDSPSSSFYGGGSRGGQGEGRGGVPLEEDFTSSTSSPFSQEYDDDNFAISRQEPEMLSWDDLSSHHEEEDEENFCFPGLQSPSSSGVSSAAPSSCFTSSEDLIAELAMPSSSVSVIDPFLRFASSSSSGELVEQSTTITTTTTMAALNAPTLPTAIPLIASSAALSSLSSSLTSPSVSPLLPKKEGHDRDPESDSSLSSPPSSPHRIGTDSATGVSSSPSMLSQSFTPRRSASSSSSSSPAGPPIHNAHNSHISVSSSSSSPASSSSSSSPASSVTTTSSNVTSSTTSSSFASSSPMSVVSMLKQESKEESYQSPSPSTSPCACDHCLLPQGQQQPQQSPQQQLQQHQLQHLPRPQPQFQPPAKKRTSPHQIIPTSAALSGRGSGRGGRKSTEEGGSGSGALVFHASNEADSRKIFAPSFTATPIHPSSAFSPAGSSHAPPSHYLFTPITSSASSSPPSYPPIPTFVPPSTSPSSSSSSAVDGSLRFRAPSPPTLLPPQQSVASSSSSSMLAMMMSEMEEHSPPPQQTTASSSSSSSQGMNISYPPFIPSAASYETAEEEEQSPRRFDEEDEEEVVDLQPIVRKRKKRAKPVGKQEAKKKKVATERQRRKELGDCFSQLNDSLPKNLKIKPTKATLLLTAVDYINYLKNQNQALKSQLRQMGVAPQAQQSSTSSSPSPSPVPSDHPHQQPHYPYHHQPHMPPPQMQTSSSGSSSPASFHVELAPASVGFGNEEDAGHNNDNMASAWSSLIHRSEDSSNPNSRRESMSMSGVSSSASSTIEGPHHRLSFSDIPPSHSHHHHSSSASSLSSGRSSSQPVVSLVSPAINSTRMLFVFAATFGFLFTFLLPATVDPSTPITSSTSLFSATTSSSVRTLTAQDDPTTVTNVVDDNNNMWWMYVLLWPLMWLSSMFTAGIHTTAGFLNASLPWLSFWWCLVLTNLAFLVMLFFPGPMMSLRSTSRPNSRHHRRRIREGLRHMEKMQRNLLQSGAESRRYLKHMARAATCFDIPAELCFDPAARFGPLLFLDLCWQVLTQLLHRMGPGIWLDQLGHRIYGGKDLYFPLHQIFKVPASEEERKKDDGGNVSSLRTAMKMKKKQVLLVTHHDLVCKLSDLYFHLSFQVGGVRHLYFLLYALNIAESIDASSEKVPAVLKQQAGTAATSSALQGLKLGQQATPLQILGELDTSSPTSSSSSIKSKRRRKKRQQKRSSSPSSQQVIAMKVGTKASRLLSIYSSVAFHRHVNRREDLPYARTKGHLYRLFLPFLLPGYWFALAQKQLQNVDSVDDSVGQFFLSYVMDSLALGHCHTAKQLCVAAMNEWQLGALNNSNNNNGNAVDDRTTMMLTKNGKRTSIQALQQQPNPKEYLHFYAIFCMAWACYLKGNFNKTKQRCKELKHHLLEVGHVIGAKKQAGRNVLHKVVKVHHLLHECPERVVPLVDKMMEDRNRVHFACWDTANWLASNWQKEWHLRKMFTAFRCLARTRIGQYEEAWQELDQLPFVNEIEFAGSSGSSAASDDPESESSTSACTVCSSATFAWFKVPFTSGSALMAECYLALWEHVLVSLWEARKKAAAESKDKKKKEERIQEIMKTMMSASSSPATSSLKEQHEELVSRIAAIAAEKKEKDADEDDEDVETDEEANKRDGEAGEPTTWETGNSENSTSSSSKKAASVTKKQTTYCKHHTPSIAKRQPSSIFLPQNLQKFRRLAHSYCSSMQRNSEKAPILQPRAWRVNALYQYLIGKELLGRTYVKKSLDLARELRMKYDEAMALYEFCRWDLFYHPPSWQTETNVVQEVDDADDGDSTEEDEEEENTDEDDESSEDSEDEVEGAKCTNLFSKKKKKSQQQRQRKPLLRKEKLQRKLEWAAELLNYGGSWYELSLVDALARKYNIPLTNHCL